MKQSGKKLLILGTGLLIAFILWTALILFVDVQPLGQNGTNIGFATFNCWFHNLTGVHMSIYTITDWLGLVPIFVCMLFGGLGLVQLIQRKNLFKVDYDILILGVYYIVVIAGFLAFEMFPINYRPILIEGVMEASYPSSTTLLVLSVMPTLGFQVKRRVQNYRIIKVVTSLTKLFSVFMVFGRLIAGVHWFTDIVGGILLSAGVFIDDLLSSEKLLSIAEKENKPTIRSMCDSLFGMIDVFAFLLIVLPLYPKEAVTMGLSCGEIVLTTAVIAILITAPFGAISIDNLYKKLLTK